MKENIAILCLWFSIFFFRWLIDQWGKRGGQEYNSEGTNRMSKDFSSFILKSHDPQVNCVPAWKDFLCKTYITTHKQLTFVSRNQL